MLEDALIPTSSFAFGTLLFCAGMFVALVIFCAVVDGLEEKRKKKESWYTDFPYDFFR